MARFVFRAFSNAEGIEVNPLTVGALFDYDQLRYNATEIRAFDSSTSYASFTGNGFAYSPAPGGLAVTGGTLTGLTVREGGTTLVQVTGWNIEAPIFANNALTGRYANVLTLMLAGNDTMIGTVAGDFLMSGAGRDVIRAGGGADRVEGGAGNDRLFGQAGNDELLGGGGNDRLTGGLGGDTLTGNAGADMLIGNGGFDRLIGGGGNDTLNGGLGGDRLEGGAGRDVFVFGSRDGTRDRIVDFREGVDRIQITDPNIDFEDIGISITPLNATLRIGATQVVVEGSTVSWDASDFLFA